MTFGGDRDSGGGADAGHCWFSSTPTCPTCKRKEQGSAPKHHGGGVWNGFLLGHAREKSFPCRSAAVLMEMGTSFGNVLTPFASNS